MEPQSVASLLAIGAARLTAAGLPDARREAAALLGAALGWDRGEVWLRDRDPVAPDTAARYMDWLDRRAAREPFAYITGEKEWFGLRLHVSPAVLIPRPETELLAEFAIAQLPLDRPTHVADLCTGSGCLAIAIAVHRPHATIAAADISAAALNIARQNAARHNVADRIVFTKTDVLGPNAPKGPFDLVVSNPPYIAPSEYTALEPDVRDHEPAKALVPATGDALAFYRAFASTPHMLKPGGALAMEIGADQAADVIALFGAGWVEPQVRQDYGGKDRIVVVPARLGHATA